MKIIVIDNKQYELLTIREAFIPSVDPRRSYVEVGSKFYPIFYGTAGNAHGIYLVNSVLYTIVTNDPTGKFETARYSIVDFNNIQSMVEMYEKNNQLNTIMKETLIPDKEDIIYYHEIQNKESNLMKALQMFLNSKQITPIRYADRFANYPNTIRILNKDRVSIDKFMEFITAMDGKATITIENKSDDVANPIPSPITMEL